MADEARDINQITEDVAVSGGKQVGNTTRGATVGAQVAVGAGSALAFLVSYAVVKSGLEQDPETAVLLGAAITAVINQVMAFFGPHEGGKRAPTDQGDAKFAQEAMEEIRQLTERQRVAAAVAEDLEPAVVPDPTPTGPQEIVMNLQSAMVDEDGKVVAGAGAPKGRHVADTAQVAGREDVWQHLGVDADDTSAAGAKANA